MLLPFGFYLLKLSKKIAHNNNLKSKRNAPFLVLAWLGVACWLWLAAQAVGWRGLTTPKSSVIIEKAEVEP